MVWRLSGHRLEPGQHAPFRTAQKLVLQHHQQEAESLVAHDLATLSALNNSHSLALLSVSVVLTMDEKLVKRLKTTSPAVHSAVSTGARTLLSLH
ncbi:hypothetical protein BN440_3156 [Erwinia amylovora MR1]|nr:hypothetical protein BN440_3156 [Erwinia amylovora MR1]